MAVTVKTKKEIELMRESNHRLEKVFDALEKLIRPGISTWEIDQAARRLIKEQGGIPNFLNYDGFPAAICTSVNEEVVHGIPRKDRILKEGDIISLDCGLILNGYHSDAARTYPVGEIADSEKKLIEVTRASFFEGIRYARAGHHLHEIGNAIGDYCESRGYGVVRDLVGHGVGPTMHEEPMVPHYGKAGRGLRLREGMVITVEPMITTGTWEIDTDMKTGWAHKTLDGSLSCQYEHQFVITKDGPVILTSQGEERTY